MHEKSKGKFFRKTDRRVFGKNEKKAAAGSIRKKM
jgi:hypothetical protein